MFYHLLNKEYRLAFVLIILLGFFLFWIDVVSEWLITSYSGVEFTYSEPAHLKLIYLLLGVVLIALTSAVEKNKNLAPDRVQQNYLKWAVTIIASFSLGEFIHVWMVSSALLNQESIMQLEQNIWFYHIADYLLVIGFSIGGFLFIKPLIHQN